MRTAKILFGNALVYWGCVASPAMAQRVQLASPVAAQPSTSASDAGATGSASGTAPAGGSPSPPPGSVYSSPPPGNYSSGAVAPAPGASSGPVPGPQPGAPPLIGEPAPAPASVWRATAPTTQPVFTPQPGTVAPPPGSPVCAPPPGPLDPYASPGVGPSSLCPQDPYLQCTPEFSVATVQKFIQRVDLDYQWLVGNGGNELGIDNVGLSCTFAFPLFFSPNAPVLVTPGFAVHYWSGPVSLPPPPDPADLPSRTYDAYIDTTWNPWVNDVFGAELNFRIGMYSDFDVVTSSSFRFMGRGEAVLKAWPHVTLKAGVWYLDRLKVKLLPAGGLCWYPNDEVHFDILFPNPRVSKRLAIWGNSEWWMYARGEYGGGSWNITRNTGLTPPVPTDGTLDRFDYNDIEVAAGLEFKTTRQMTGHFEVGIACSRELIYQSGMPPSFYPNNTVFLGAGLAF